MGGSVCEHSSETTHPNFTNFSGHITRGHGSALVIAIRPGFVDDVSFSRSGLYGAMLIPLQRRAAASLYVLTTLMRDSWLRHVLDDGGRQDWRVIRVRGVGSGVCDADAPLRWVGELIDRVNRQQRRPCQSADVKHVGNSMQL